MTSQPSANDIITTNPYESHPSLTPLESAVLWEYAKLAHNVRMVCLVSSFFTPQVTLGDNVYEALTLFFTRSLQRRVL